MDTTVPLESAEETLAKTISEATAAMDLNAIANILSWPIIICITIICGSTAWLIHYIIQKTQGSGNFLKILPICIPPTASLFAILFGGDDGFQVRIVITALILLVCCIFISLFEKISSCIERKNNESGCSSNGAQPINITLPIQYTYAIDKRFVDDIPSNVASIIHVSEEIRIFTNDFIESFANQVDDKKRDEKLRGYFLGICYHLATLFDCNTRVHVRILKGAKYQKFISTYVHPNGKCEPDKQDMKDMSYDNQMIAQSFEKRCSLIKTLNPTLHEEGSRKKFKNYLMFALPQITHDNKPVFSVGISITQRINERFYFLNYCEIESIIGRYIEDILYSNKECKLGEFVERYYFHSS